MFPNIGFCSLKVFRKHIPFSFRGLNYFTSKQPRKCSTRTFSHFNPVIIKHFNHYFFNLVSVNLIQEKISKQNSLEQSEERESHLPGVYVGAIGKNEHSVVDDLTALVTLGQGDQATGHFIYFFVIRVLSLRCFAKLKYDLKLFYKENFKNSHLSDKKE